MHVASYGTLLRQARSESELSRTGLGALLGGSGALPQAFGAVKNARVRVCCVVNDRRSAGRADFVRPRSLGKTEPLVSGGSAIKNLGFGAYATG